MALGFKVADGYVEVHAKYDKGELRKAAQDAADDSDTAFNKEREGNARSGETRDTNRTIGRQASLDFTRGMREQIAREKESPLINVTGLRKQMSQLGKVEGPKSGRFFSEEFLKGFDKHLEQEHIAGKVANAADRDVARNRSRFKAIGQKIVGHMFGKDNAARAATNFFKSFAEAITFGQADFSRPIISGPLTKIGAVMGSTLGIAMAGALVVQIGNAITAALPLVLGAAILALPIADLIARNVTLEKGKLSFKKNDIGQTLKGFIRQAQQLADAMGKVFKGPFIAGLKQATALFKQIEGPMKRAVQAITPGAMAMWKGFLSGIIAFGNAFKPALAGINAGLKQWGIEFPKIGKALGEMFAQILKNPELVRNAVKGLSSTIQFLIKALGYVVNFLTLALGAWHNLWRIADVGWKIFSKWSGLGGTLSKIWNALKPLRKALLDAWEAFKKFASAGNDKQALQRFKVLLDKIKKVWDALKPILKKALQVAWDKLKEYWNAHVKPWWDNTAKPWLEKKLKAVAKAAFKALVDAAIAELKKLPDKVKKELDKIPGKVKTALKKAVDDAKTKAKELVDGFIKKLKELPGKAATEAGKVKSKVVGALKGAGSWLLAAGKSIIQGLIDGVQSKLGALGTALGKVAAFVKAHKGPPEKDAVLLVEAGQLMMQGLMDGIDSKRNALGKQLGGLTNQITAMAGANSGNSYSSSFSPTVHVHVSAGLETVNSAAKRALTKDIFLALEQYRKDYVK